ncbi:MAG: hypothetical protein WCF85_11290, partial [Rhodospirillaceae bacterium]
GQSSVPATKVKSAPKKPKSEKDKAAPKSEPKGNPSVGQSASSAPSGDGKTKPGEIAPQSKDISLPVSDPIPVNIRGWLSDMIDKCAADREAVSAALTGRKNFTNDLKNGMPTCFAAGASILAMAKAMEPMSAEQKRALIESLVIKDKNGRNKNLTFNKRAQTSVITPLTIFGYGNMSGGHVSKMGIIVRYAQACGITPDGFEAFLAGDSCAKGAGFKNTYDAAKDFFNPRKAEAEKKAAQDREAVIQTLKQAPSIGTIDVPLATPASDDGFYCLIAVRGPDGKVRVVSPVHDRDGMLFNYLLSTFIPDDDTKVAPVLATHAKANLKAAAKGATAISKAG